MISVYLSFFSMHAHASLIALFLFLPVHACLLIRIKRLLRVLQAEEAEALAAAAAAAAGNSKTPEPAKVTPKIFTARRARDRLKKTEDSLKEKDEDEIDDPALENLKGEDSEPVKVR